VLTGPNNMGKTWFAWTVYGLMRTAANWLSPAMPTALSSALVVSLMQTGAASLDDASLEASAIHFARAVTEALRSDLADLFASSRSFFEATRIEWVVPPLPPRPASRGGELSDPLPRDGPPVLIHTWAMDGSSLKFTWPGASPRVQIQWRGGVGVFPILLCGPHLRPRVSL